MDEIWKVYKDTRKAPNGCLYEVSNLGNIKANGVLIELRDRNYLEFGGHYRVHRAVAELFVPNPNNYNEVDHIDGNKFNNRADNLRWVTHKENANNPNTIQNIIKPLIDNRPNKPNFNHIWIHLGDKTKLVHKDYLDYWLDDGWKLGNKKKK